jgi:hypothetical protein
VTLQACSMPCEQLRQELLDTLLKPLAVELQGMPT